MSSALTVLITSWFDTEPGPGPSQGSTGSSSSSHRKVRPHSSQGKIPPLASTSIDDFLAAYAACDKTDITPRRRARSSNADRPSHDATFLSDFHVNFLIVDGKTSTVHTGLRQTDRRKVLLKSTVSDVDGMGNAKAEFQLLQRFSHPNIINALDLVFVADRSVLVLEFFDGMQLDCAVRTTSPTWLPEPVVRALCEGLMAGTQHLHEREAAHGDLCPHCILVSYDFQRVKILDFIAMARRHSGRRRGAGACREHRRYAAPEVILGAEPSASSDVWQIGLCVYLMLSGHLPQKRDQRLAAGRPGAMDAAQHVSIEHLREWSISEPCASVLQGCLRVDARQRAALPELLGHPWLRAQRGPQAPGGPGDRNPLLLGLEQVGADGVPLPRLFGRRSMPRAKTGRTQLMEASDQASDAVVEQDAKLPGTPSTKIQVFRPFAADATIVTANHADRTYKVRLSNGSMRTVRVEDTKVCMARDSEGSGSTTGPPEDPR